MVAAYIDRKPACDLVGLNAQYKVEEAGWDKAVAR